MGKRRKVLTKNEILDIAQYQWANIRDIMDIGAIGKNNARIILNEIMDAYYGNREKIKNGLDDEKERKLLEDTIKDKLMDIEGNVYNRLNLDSVESHHALEINIFIDALTLEELRDVEQGARDYVNNP